MNAARVFIVLAVLLMATTAVMADPDIYAWYRLKAEVTDMVYPGEQVDLDIDLTFCEQAFAGYDILLQYDPGVLSVVNAQLGSTLVDCDWEYFEYRTDETGLLRLIAVADIADGPNSPSCYLGTGTVATVNFEVLTGGVRGASPVRFYWADCGDNAFSNIDGDTLFVSDDVFERDSTLITGTPYIGGIDISCFGEGSFSSPGYLAPFIDFMHGAVTIGALSGCDPNGNGIPWGTDDLVFLINYMFLGGDSPDPLSDGDCTCDGYLNILDITRFIDYVFRGAEDPCGGDR